MKRDGRPTSLTSRAFVHLLRSQQALHMSAHGDKYDSRGSPATRNRRRDT